jgi:hypothetical protein
MYEKGVMVVSLDDVQPPTARTRLDEQRALSILKGIRDEQVLPPVEVHAPPDSSACCFRLKNGFHRYHLSRALGFTYIPVTLTKFFEL